MNKHIYLQSLLKDEKVDLANPASAWACNHLPLKSPHMFTHAGRHLNNFCIGSDPELSLQVAPTRKAEAYAVGLKVGLAVGADQNERLVEFRPYPSKSVVEHVAGILTDFRWLYRVYGHTLGGKTILRAGAFFDGDGMGGHVHFGRKRPSRPEEIQALDGLTFVLSKAGFFPVVEWAIRSAGDARGQRYGLLGDMRVQKHGYEYRTLPSWLQSPIVAFIVLASSKLAVLDPDITKGWSLNRELTIVDARHKLRGLAKLYKGRDDDAYLLYHVLTRQDDVPFRVDYAADCAPQWGIPAGKPKNELEQSTILPACIKPTAGEVREIQDYLLFGRPLDFVWEKPEFKTAVPEGYRWVPESVGPRRRSGFGDCIHDLVVHSKFRINWDYTTVGPFGIFGELPLRWNGVEKALLRKYCPDVVMTSKLQETVITIPRDLCQAPTLSGLKTILTKSGMFPIWTVENVQKNSYDEWLTGHCIKNNVLQIL